MPTKPDQPGPSEPTREEEVPARPEYTSPPRRHATEPAIAPMKVSVNTIVEEVVRELEGEQSQANMEEATSQLARIDTMQTGSEEPIVERMKELPTSLIGSTLEPI